MPGILFHLTPLIFVFRENHRTVTSLFSCFWNLKSRKNKVCARNLESSMNHQIPNPSNIKGISGLILWMLRLVLLLRHFVRFFVADNKIKLIYAFILAKIWVLQVIMIYWAHQLPWKLSIFFLMIFLSFSGLLWHY